MARLKLILMMSLLISGCAQNQVKQVHNLLQLEADADQLYADKQCEQAIPLYMTLAQNMTTDTKSLLRVGNCQVRMGNYDAAQQTYLSALQRDPQNAKLWYNLSFVRAKQLARTVSMMYENVPPNAPEVERIRTLTIDVLKPFKLTPEQNTD